MMLSEMMKGGNASSNGGMSGMFPLLLMGRGGEGLFEGIFDMEDPEEDIDGKVSV